MGCGRVQTVLFICGIMQLLETVYLLECPIFQKKEAISKNLLNENALCRASKYEIDENICLNGLSPTGPNCETSDCVGSENQNCEKRCLTGDDDGNKEFIEYDMQWCIDEEQRQYCQLFKRGSKHMGMYSLYRAYAVIKCESYKKK